jgi:putative transposase
MVAIVVAVLTCCLSRIFCHRHCLGLEVVALRQQLVVFKRKQTRPRIQRLDRLFWVCAAAFLGRMGRPPDHWELGYRGVKASRWVSLVLAMVFPAQRRGRPKVSEEIRQWIRLMKSDNPSWGTPPIHGQLLQLGFEVSELRCRATWKLKAVP